MCTIGCVSTVNRQGERVVYLIKNMDLVATPFSCTQIRNPIGHDFLAFVSTRQPGVNSGLNAAGLGLVISHSDYRLYVRPAEDGKPPLAMTGDFRTMGNAVVLSECNTVDEAIAFFQGFVPRHPDMPGGNHMLADAEGNLAVVEHCDGQMRFEVRRGGGYLARGNNSRLLIQEKQAQTYPDRYEDAYKRSQAMEAAVARWYDELGAGLSQEDFLAHARAVLGSHDSPAGDGVGRLCRHGLVCRYTGLAVWTLSGMVFDVVHRRLFYTVGSACQNEWQRLDFAGSPLRLASLPAVI